MYEDTEYEQVNAPAEPPPTAMLQKELAERHRSASRRARDLHMQAREWQRIESAYGAALQALKESSREDMPEQAMY